MKRFWVFFIFSLLGFVFIFQAQFGYAATPEYHYNYFLNTHGSQFSSNETLEIRLNVNTRGETMQQGQVTLNYDPGKLEFQEAVAWNIFKELNTDTSRPGQIIITSHTNLVFSGEAPFAILRFKTISEINNLAQVLTVNKAILPTTPLTPTITQINPSVTLNPSITQSLTPSLTPNSTPSTTPPLSPIPTLTGSGIPDCPNLSGNGNFVIVILGDHFNDLNDFLSYAQKGVDSMNATNLGSQNLQKFTWRVYTDLSQDYGIVIDAVVAKHEHAIALQKQQHCDGNAYLLISKKFPTISDSYGTGGYALLGQRVAVIFHHSIFVTTHELGHALVALWEEYYMGVTANEIGLPTSQSPFVNCAGSSKQHCTDWQQAYPNDPEIDCIPVCGVTDWFRPTQCSAMNNNIDCMDYYNAPSLAAWDEFFAQY